MQTILFSRLLFLIFIAVGTNIIVGTPRGPDNWNVQTLNLCFYYDSISFLLHYRTVSCGLTLFHTTLMLFLTTSRLIIIIGTSSNAYFNYLAFESQSIFIYMVFLLGQLGCKNIKSLICTSWSKCYLKPNFVLHKY